MDGRGGGAPLSAGHFIYLSFCLFILPFSQTLQNSGFVLRWRQPEECLAALENAPSSSLSPGWLGWKPTTGAGCVCSFTIVFVPPPPSPPHNIVEIKVQIHFACKFESQTLTVKVFQHNAQGF